MDTHSRSSAAIGTRTNPVKYSVWRRGPNEGIEGSRKIISFVNDLAVLVRAGDMEELEHRSNESLRRISRWMNISKLVLAQKRQRGVILRGRWKKQQQQQSLKIMLRGMLIRPSKVVRYIFIILDDLWSFGNHTCRVVKKGEESFDALSMLIKSLGGPESQERILLSEVFH